MDQLQNKQVWVIPPHHWWHNNETRNNDFCKIEQHENRWHAGKITNQFVDDTLQLEIQLRYSGVVDDKYLSNGLFTVVVHPDSPNVSLKPPKSPNVSIDVVPGKKKKNILEQKEKLILKMKKMMMKKMMISISLNMYQLIHYQPLLVKSNLHSTIQAVERDFLH